MAVQQVYLLSFFILFSFAEKLNNILQLLAYMI